MLESVLFSSFCPSSSLSICLPLISSLSICLALSVSCSFSAICERAALCPRHINTQWPSQGLQQRAQVPFSVSLTDFILHLLCLIFRPQNRTAHSLNSTLLERTLLYLRKRPKKVSSYCILCPLFSLLSPSTLFLSLKISHVFLSPPPAPCLSSSPSPIHAGECIIPELLSCSILISVDIITECPNKMHSLYTQTYLDLSGLARPVKGTVHQNKNETSVIMYSPPCSSKPV